jgi:glutaredoxin-like protein
MIPLHEQELLKQFLEERLTGPVKIDHFSQRPLRIVVPGREECRYCTEARRLLSELCGLSPKISLSVHELSEAKALADRYRIERVPATVLRGQQNRPVLVEGFPTGSLLPSLVEAITFLSTGKTYLEARLKRRLERIRDDVELRVFVSPATEFSLMMMRSAIAFAVENRHIKTTIIEAEEFPRLAELYRISRIPFTVIGERLSFTGAVDDATLLDQLVKAVEGHTLTGGEGLLGVSGPSTPLAGLPEATVSRSGLIIPGR